MNGYLKAESYYNDFYDLGTIKGCLEVVERWQNVRSNIINDKKEKSLSEKEKECGFDWLLNWELFVAKGERYQNKASTINDWMERDHRLDEKFNTTLKPENVLCPDFGVLMKSTFKNLYNFSDEPLRVLFFFECSQCQKRKGIFDDGRSFVSKPEHCPKCNGEIKVSFKEKSGVLTWKRKCHACGFSEIEIDDSKKTKDERLKKEQEDRRLLKKYRSEFCLTEAQGLEYRENQDRLKAMSELLDEAQKRETDPSYKKVSKLKKLNIVELKKYLTKVLQKEKYINLATDKPEINRYVIVPFSIQDADSIRKEYDSKSQLQKIIRKTLNDTNWRLMSEGVSYRLGYLSGRLKGYEQESDLLQVVKSASLSGNSPSV